jgi:hypothetical protein
MATVRLDLRECREGGLPDVCVQCGEHATHFEDRQFAWLPNLRWLLVLLPLGVFPFIIAALLMTRCRIVTVPLCADHRNHWLTRQLFVGIAVGSIGLTVALMIGTAELYPEFAKLGPIVAGILPVVLMIVGLILVGTTQIQPTEITERTITLRNVSQTFVVALENFRDEEDRNIDLDRIVQEFWRDRDRDRDGRGDRDHRRTSWLGTRKR